MKSYKRYWFVVCILASALVLAGCGQQNAGQQASQPSAKAPYHVQFKWGTFTLSSRIADKIKNKEPLNFVLSYQTLASVDAASEHQTGMERAAKYVEQKYGVNVNTRVVGPTETNAPQQIAEIESLINANQVDALAIQPPSATGFEGVIDFALKHGVPVWTDNSDAPDSNRIAYYGPNDTPTGNGVDVAKYVLSWAKQNNFQFKAIAITTGDTTAQWAQGRMAGFISTIQAALPNVRIYGTPTDAAVNTGWDSAGMYAKSKAFLIGHPDVNFVFNSDWGSVPIAQAVKDLGLQGKVFVMGYNVSDKILSFIGNSPLIGTCDQNMPGQSETWVKGAAAFLLEGTVPSDPMQYTPVRIVTPENVQKVKADLGYK